MAGGLHFQGASDSRRLVASFVISLLATRTFAIFARVPPGHPSPSLPHPDAIGQQEVCFPSPPSLSNHPRKLKRSLAHFQAAGYRSRPTFSSLQESNSSAGTLANCHQDTLSSGASQPNCMYTSTDASRNALQALNGWMEEANEPEAQQFLEVASVENILGCHNTG